MAPRSLFENDEDMFDPILGQRPIFPTPDGKPIRKEDLKVSQPTVIKKPSAVEKPMPSPPPVAPSETPKPIDPVVLKELAKSDPDLVQRYKERMGIADEAVEGARDTQDMTALGNVFGRIANDYTNSQKNDTIYKNNWQNMGNAPTIQRAERKAWDDKPLAQIGQQAVDRAKSDRDKAENEFATEQKLTDISQSRADAQKARDKASRLEDPASEESAAARAYLKQVAPNATTMEGYDRLSAAQIDKIAPGLYQSYNAAEQRKSQAEDRKANREFQAAIRGDARQDRQDARAEDRKYKEGQEAEKRTQKMKDQVLEVEDRRRNIKENLVILDDMIKDKGTYEMTGSHNQDLDRLVDQIATDMAKLSDPSSVARPSEVDQVKKNLIQSGFQNTNATAREIIKNFGNEVDRRADSAYKVRGIPAPQKSGIPHGSDLPD